MQTVPSLSTRADWGRKANKRRTHYLLCLHRVNISDIPGIIEEIWTTNITRQILIKSQKIQKSRLKSYQKFRLNYTQNYDNLISRSSNLTSRVKNSQTIELRDDENFEKQAVPDTTTLEFKYCKFTAGKIYLIATVK